MHTGTCGVAATEDQSVAQPSYRRSSGNAPTGVYYPGNDIEVARMTKGRPTPTPTNTWVCSLWLFRKRRYWRRAEVAFSWVASWFALTNASLGRVYHRGAGAQRALVITRLQGRWDLRILPCILFTSVRLATRLNTVRQCWYGASHGFGVIRPTFLRCGAIKVMLWWFVDKGTNRANKSKTNSPTKREQRKDRRAYATSAA